MNSKELRVLMISADPGLVEDDAGTGDVLYRHKIYSDRVKSLDIVVFGGAKKESKKISEKLMTHATGVKGIKNLFVGKKVAEGIVNSKQIDVIVTQDPHATGWIGAQLKRKYSISHGVHFHGDFWNNDAWAKESLTNRIKSLMQKSIVDQADLLRVVSRGIEKKLIDSGIEESKIRVINTPVNSNAFVDLPDKQKVRIEELKYKYKNRKVVLFVGRLAAAKNIPFMLEVINELRETIPEVLLFIIGKGVEHDSTKKLIAEKKLDTHIQLLGAKDLQELVLYYSIARIVLLLSTNESFGKVIIEAGFSGTPTLASKTTGAKHIIKDGKTGFVVPINDKTSTVGVLYEMLDTEEQTKQLGEWAKEEYIKTYSTEKTIDAVINFWKELASL